MLSVVDELCMPAYTNRVRSYHWILLIIRIDDGTVEVLDSLSKDPEEYRSLHSMLDR
jgi:Ulp1 family protease